MYNQPTHVISDSPLILAQCATIEIDCNLIEEKVLNLLCTYKNSMYHLRKKYIVWTTEIWLLEHGNPNN